jgi:hypothetical protein
MGGHGVVAPGARKAAVIAAVLVAALVGLAFVIAPRACRGGLQLYAWAGVGVVAVLLTLPSVVRAGRGALARTLWTVGLVALGMLAWVGGIVAANVPIMCRMY